MMLKWLKGITYLLVAVGLLVIFVDFARFPECYMSTWRYHLGNDLKRGDVEAVEFYQRNYLDKGRVLFDWYEAR